MIDELLKGSTTVLWYTRDILDGLPVPISKYNFVIKHLEGLKKSKELDLLIDRVKMRLYEAKRISK